MDEAEAQRQIKQMVNFILNEAKDKAEEIEAKALEDFNIEKLKLVQQMKEKIRQDMARKTKALETQRAIARSKAINESRLQKMIKRNDFINQTKDEISNTLSAIMGNKGEATRIYSSLLTESAMQLLEEDLEVRCRKSDIATVESAYQAAAQKYSQQIKQQTGVDKKVKFITSKTHFLPENSVGGVTVLCHDSLIRVDNTLDTRIRQHMETNTPMMREILFPLR